MKFDVVLVETGDGNKLKRYTIILEQGMKHIHTTLRIQSFSCYDVP